MKNTYIAYSPDDPYELPMFVGSYTELKRWLKRYYSIGGCLTHALRKTKNGLRYEFKRVYVDIVRI